MNIWTTDLKGICLLERAFSQLVLNTCFSCSTNSDIASVISSFITCMKDDSEVLSLPYHPFLFGRYDRCKGKSGISKVKQANLVHRKLHEA